MAEPLEMINHDDGTHTVHLVSLNAGCLRIEHLSIIEVYNLVDELDRCDDSEAVLLKWAQGYRDANMYELAECGDDWEEVLAQEVLTRWKPTE